MTHEELKSTNWGDGFYPAEHVLLLKQHLTYSELVLAHSLHLQENWPVVNVTFKTVGRGKAGHLGHQPRMMGYREQTAELLLYLAETRAELVQAKSGQAPATVLGLNEPQLRVALRNVGVDLDDPDVAERFYCGSRPSDLEALIGPLP